MAPMFPLDLITDIAIVVAMAAATLTTALELLTRHYTPTEAR